MKLFPNEPALDLYNEGFGDDDLLQRRPSGEKLSNLVERIDSPLVIVLDGPWGCGKSYFLKRWVGAHGLENGGTATTVYFDAFAHDFLDDPLTAIGGAILAKLDGKEKPKARKAFRGAIATLARPAAKIALAMGTAGISEVTGVAVDAALSAGKDEIDKRIDNFWKREDGKRAAMEQVESSLREIAGEPGADNSSKLVIVVDELDRCRPDYALAVIEVIKHFFAVPNVHFILGVNLDALEHSVRSRYGNQFDAEGYLRRFISVTMTLPDTITQGSEIKVKQAYFRRHASAMNTDERLARAVDDQLDLGGKVGEATIRDVGKILSLVALLPIPPFPGIYLAEIVVSLVLMKALDPQLHARAIRGDVEIEDIREFYGMTDVMLSREAGFEGGYVHTAYVLNGLWTVLLKGSRNAEDDNFSRSFERFGSGPYSNVFRLMRHEFFDVFRLPEP